MSKRIRKNRGFSLIELIVAASVFVGVMVMVVGIYSLFINKQRQQVDQQLLQRELQNFFDVFEREAKTAYVDDFELDATDPTHISFLNQEQEYAASAAARRTSQYKLDSVSKRIMYRDKTQGASESDVVFIPLTSTNVSMEKLNFVVSDLPAVTSSPTGEYLSGASLRITIDAKACTKSPTPSCINAQQSLTVRQTKPITKF